VEEKETVALIKMQRAWSKAHSVQNPKFQIPNLKQNPSANSKSRNKNKWQKGI
jgi:hypothetical protein